MTTPSLARRARALLVPSAMSLGLAFFLAACTGGGDPDDAPSGGTGVEVDAEAQALSATAVDPENPLASQEVAWVDGSTATVDLYGLRVDGKTMIVTFGITPHTETDTSVYKEFDVFPGFDVQVVDTENLKRYRIIEVDGQEWGSHIHTEIPGNSTTYLWAGFAAPEDDIDKADVIMFDGWAPFADVTIQR